MHERQDRTSTRLSAFLSVAALFVAAAVATWGLTTGIMWSAPEKTIDKDPVTGALGYVAQRPLDPVGWLSWAGARGLLTTNEPLATQVIQAAAILGPVDPQVLRAKALLAFQQGNVAAGLNLAADLAVSLTAERGAAFATLRAHSGHPDWNGFWSARLAAGWKAVDAFLLDSCQNGASLSTLFSLAQLAVSKQPLDDATVTCIGNKAISEGQVSAAYWLWVNAMSTTPKSLGNVFNGNFEAPVAGRLFDWRFAKGGEYREGFSLGVSREESVAAAGRARSADINNVLSIRFNGRALKMPIAQQFLALQPGRYLLTYKSRELGAIAPETIRWTVRCIPANLALTVGARRSEPASNGWTLHVVQLSIPDACSGQLLDLEAGDRVQLSQGFRGTVSFDDISMKHIPASGADK